MRDAPCKGVPEGLSCFLHFHSILHICHCPDCQGKVWDHSPSSWEEHLGQISPRNVEPLYPKDYDCDGNAMSEKSKQHEGYVQMYLQLMMERNSEMVPQESS